MEKNGLSKRIGVLEEQVQEITEVLKQIKTVLLDLNEMQDQSADFAINVSKEILVIKKQNNEFQQNQILHNTNSNRLIERLVERLRR